ncbi:phosphonate metabolism protein/1,5-bisphosphokinase (PRPP-forming) PhnN [Sulfitobacter sp. D35]|uniref:phosphonate metabolism protein/1,5-bisphosphokinase (PRPP-forming) PhnN n=1 Tax=Sulfitobacter sp. D35 TaxID=3083252 RepID=UPI00296EEBAC|nr:phosphonate metabolism protein/1,5-bisphosphokinase (PRPP-forming) PhnN [Sulfitobacter sp. D35]MDW4499211.1 phosphonate metabolism protein/1,5-bisphosphokinase (PRPP-forming) PhnN [Sulfitobacter sp. D35]
MTLGRLIAVVGPSGVGKDSVMQGVVDAVPGFHLVRRVITRAPGLGGEDHVAVSVPEFRDMADAGAFAVHWRAHGLCYGIPRTVRHKVNEGTDCLANFSRRALRAGAEAFPNFQVLNITAKPETLAARLAARGRESEAEIERRLAEASKTLPADFDVITLSNDGPLEQTIARAVALLKPVSV